MKRGMGHHSWMALHEIKGNNSTGDSFKVHIYANTREDAVKEYHFRYGGGRLGYQVRESRLPAPAPAPAQEPAPSHAHAYTHGPGLALTPAIRQRKRKTP